jgi:hypothetical protein
MFFHGRGVSLLSTADYGVIKQEWTLWKTYPVAHNRLIAGSNPAGPTDIWRQAKPKQLDFSFHFVTLNSDTQHIDTHRNDAILSVSL